MGEQFPGGSGGGMGAGRRTPEVQGLGWDWGLGRSSFASTIPSSSSVGLTDYSQVACACGKNV